MSAPHVFLTPEATTVDREAASTTFSNDTLEFQVGSATAVNRPPLRARLVRVFHGFFSFATTWSTANGQELTNALLAVPTPQAITRGFERLRVVPSIDEAVTERYTPEPYDQETLAVFAPGTLGAAYREFFETHALDHGLIPDGLTQHVSQDFDYYARRVAEVHEFVHVLGDFGIDLQGEVGTIAFTVGNCMGHMGRAGVFAALPGLVILVAGTLCVCRAEPRATGRVLTTVLDALRRGTRADPLWNSRFEDHWDEPLSSVQVRFGFAS